jgi:hypothetical protein
VLVRPKRSSIKRDSQLPRRFSSHQ